MTKTNAVTNIGEGAALNAATHPVETPQAAFSRLGTKRVKNTLKHLRLVGQLSNKSSYAYTEEQVAKMFETIDAAVTEAKAKFAGVKTQRAEDLFAL